MTVSFTRDNTYPTNIAKHVFVAVFISFVLFWVARLASGLLSALHHRAHVRSTRTRDGRTEPVVHTASSSPLQRVENALRDVFITLAVVSLLWLNVNGRINGFELFVWITLALGVLWAVAKGTACPFADGMLLLFIPAAIVLWALVF